MSDNGYNAPGRQATPTPVPVVQPVPTPQFTDPSSQIVGYYPRFWPNLTSTGLFRVFENVERLMGASAHGTPYQFNCFAWSLGFTDRWVEGGDVAAMEQLYTAYFFSQCNQPEAEVELYRILDAPAGTPKAQVMHAHRRDDPSLDTAPGLGCSSKMAASHLISHNRLGLTDNRSHSARPPVRYGSIYQHWRRDSARHPTFTGEGIEVYPAQGHRPEHKIFELGPGQYPPGHPGNSIGAPALAPPEGNSSGGGGSTRTSRSARSTPSFEAESGKSFSNIAGMKPYDKIPAPSVAAVIQANNAHAGVMSKNAELVKSFDAKWSAWSKLWFPQGKKDEPTIGPSSTLESTEFKTLTKLGAKIVPLVVYKLATEPAANFPGVFLYNAVESEGDYRVSRRDVVNYCVLQRQANLIVEMNAGRTGGGGRGLLGANERGWEGATTRGVGDGGGGRGATARGMGGEAPAKKKGKTRRAGRSVGRVLICGMGGTRREKQ